MEADGVLHAGFGHAASELADVGLLAVAVDVQQKPRQLVPGDADGLDRRFEAVAPEELAVVQQAEAPVGGACPGPGGEVARVRSVHNDFDLSGRGVPGEKEVADPPVDGDDGIGVGQGGPLDEHEKREEGRPGRDTVEALEELRRDVVHVEEHAGPQDLRDEGGEDQKVGQVVDLDDRVTGAGVEHGEPRGGQEEEGGVLGEIAEGALSAPVADRHPVDADVADPFGGGFGLLPQTDEVDLDAGVGQGLALAPDAHVVRVVGVADHRDPHGRPPFPSTRR